MFRTYILFEVNPLMIEWDILDLVQFNKDSGFEFNLETEIALKLLRENHLR
jgi:hypothetical protein